MSKPIRILSLFARHKVAANLLMAIMLLSGVWALMRLNVQFLPTFNIEIITVSVPWRGASAEDVENSIINPIEQELRHVDYVKKLSSVARTGNGTITLEFYQGTDMGQALEQVREKMAQIRDMPPDAEPPIITRVEPYESVAKLIVSGPRDLEQLRPLVRRFERDLLDRGIAKIDIVGLPEQEIAIQIPITTLIDLNVSLPQIAERIAARSQDFPAGTIGKREVGKQLRSLQQQRSIRSFEQLPIISNAEGQLLRLGDIAEIKQRARDNEIKASYKGKPAIEMRLLRTGNDNALTTAKRVHEWLREVTPQLGKGVQLHLYDEHWQYIKERIDLLIKNGVGGLILIIAILFLFLNRRVALWVVIGIPTSFMAALAVLYLYGGSINMVSLFAFIMSLGIIVDDTIVVGEQALTNIHQGQTTLNGILNATQRMLPPILSSSLTTVSAFFPLFFIGGVIGTILFTIPLVVTYVILASVIECFFVLPGHLAHSFRHYRESDESTMRVWIRERFEHFKDHVFRPFLQYALTHRLTTLSAAGGLLLVSIGLVIGDHVQFTFFPSPAGRILNTNVQFTVGTPPQKVHAFMQHLNNTLHASDAENIVQHAVIFENFSAIDRYRNNRGEQYASMSIELTSPDSRSISNENFIKRWKQRITLPGGLEHFSIFTPRGGPPGEDIDIQISGDNPQQLKAAALHLTEALTSFDGVSDIKDDLPFGQAQLVFDVNSTGRTLGLTVTDVGRQLRAAFNGQIAQIFHLPNEEVEVRVMLPDKSRDSLATLEQFPIVTAQGKTVPLGTVVKVTHRRGPETLLHTDTKLATHVTAKVDPKRNNANKILKQLGQTLLPKLTADYPIKIRLRGKAEEQAETFADMKYGLLLGFTLIYIILAWVFSSYTWPLIVMAAIPLGLTGAIIGHLLMGLDLTILSLFGLFGLSGIVINDSIILLSEYKHLRTQNTAVYPAILEASCRRLRAVLLTSLTTIAGLTPLLFETSLQAQFLIPMATSLCFGLAYATVLILVVVPVLLSFYEGRANNITHEKT